MSSTIKSGLVTGACLVILNFFSGLFCQLCGPVGALIGGGVAGFLSQNWGEVDPGPPPAQQGAIAGAMAGVGAMIGQLVSLTINVYLVGSGQVSLLEDLFGPATPASLLIGSVVWGAAALVGLVLAAGAGALAGHLSGNRQVAV